MRVRWKILRGTGIFTICAVALVVGQSGIVQGDPTSATNPTTSENGAVDPESLRDPNTAYPLGPGAIPYDQLTAADRASVDLIQETTETSQPDSSYQGWATVTTLVGEQAEAEIAARAIGLEGTEQDGVMP